MEKPYVKTAV